MRRSQGVWLTSEACGSRMAKGSFERDMLPNGTHGVTDD
jgi:hypothetical protein